VQYAYLTRSIVWIVQGHTPSIDEVRSYWEQNPLLSHELGELPPGEHWKHLDLMKRTDIEAFSEKYWGFDESQGKSILDIGCGPGWLTVTYASAGAAVTAVDLTQTAVDITKSVLASKSLKADVKVANAEQLPFGDCSFDIVVSSGVLHHTPDTNRCFAEAFRVTNHGGIGRITLYRLGPLHRPFIFPVVRAIMRLTRTAHPGANLATTASSVEDFIRQYDGAENPLGIARSDSDWQTALEAAGWRVISSETHYFPARMVPLLRKVPRSIHRLLDKYLGTMVYFTLLKPNPARAN